MSLLQSHTLKFFKSKVQPKTHHARNHWLLIIYTSNNKNDISAEKTRSRHVYWDSLSINANYLLRNRFPHLFIKMSIYQYIVLLVDVACPSKIMNELGLRVQLLIKR